LKVKKYVGDTIQDTIFKVKSELGSDAIILNTRKYKKGGIFGFFGKTQIEVLAALEEEDKNNTQALQEINELKEMFNTFSQRWQADGFVEALSDNLIRIYNHLLKQGIEIDLCKQIINKLEKFDEGDYNQLLEILRKELINIIGSSREIKTGFDRCVILFAGSTGAGKTTTIAKLAARFALDDNKRVGLITSDTYRIAAVEQLKTYSDIINIPLKIAYNINEIKEILEDDYRDFELVFVDTAGSSWRDEIQLEQLQKICTGNLINEVHLLLSLNTKSNDIKKIISRFNILNPQKILLTKFDETTIFGDIINIKKRYDLPYSYFTYGQDVPDDISVARADVLANYILGDLYD